MPRVPQQRDQGSAAYELRVLRARDLRVALSASGELVSEAAPALSTLFHEQLAAGHIFVRLDVSRVTVIGGSCLEVLLTAHVDYQAAHGMLILQGVAEPISQVLVTTRLDRCLFFTAEVSPRDWLGDLTDLATQIQAQRGATEALPVI